MSWLSLYENAAWSDYEVEALPAVRALLDGRFARFASLAPPYGGSLLLRAPFALLASLWGGGELAVYRAYAAPCLLASLLLGLWVFGRMRRAGAPALARGLTLALFVCNPLTLPAIEFGHPEELLCACLCVAAVLLAANGRATWAGLLLGLAIASKYWPVIALGPVLLSLPSARRRCLASCALGAGALLAPIALLSGHFLTASRAAASTTSAVFMPWQAFWFLGTPLHGSSASSAPGGHTAPAWIGAISHPLLIAVAFALSAGLWWRRRRSGGPLCLDGALMLLTLTMLLRCLLDTLDNAYYVLPFLFALLTWESHARRAFAASRPALISLCATALCWVSFESLPGLLSANLVSGFFLAWTVPLAAAFLLRLLAPDLRRGRVIVKARLRPRSAPSATS